MNSRERILAAISFQPVDILPVEIHPSPAGVYEHGQKLIDLMKACGSDFGDLSTLSLPQVPREDFDTDGRYHKLVTDAWGTTWEYRIYGVWGHRKVYPLADMSRLANYRFPEVKRLEGAELEKQRQAVQAHQQRYFYTGGGASLFETMQSLRPFDDVLIDINEDTPEINRLADRLVEYNRVLLENALAIGADAVSVGDDYGTQQALMISPKVWRCFFKPRYEALLAPARQAGRPVFFHSCGQISAIIDDLHEVGATAIWPQLALFDTRALAKRCRELGLSVQLHPDRGELMQRATPQQVSDYIYKLVDDFRCFEGGSWLYLEIDPGFPWENVQALFETATKIRQGH